MTPTTFPEANATFGPPPGVSEQHVMPVPAMVTQVDRGAFDGARLVVVAWKPDAEDIARIVAGGPVFLCSLGGLCPHFLVTDLVPLIKPT